MDFAFFPRIHSLFPLLPKEVEDNDFSLCMKYFLTLKLAGGQGFFESNMGIFFIAFLSQIEKIRERAFSAKHF